LFVAAGGGGDALAAVIVHSAFTGPRAEPPVIATYAWDRLLVDPLPGPRDVESFTGLDQVGPRTFLVTGRSRPVPPAGSTLPRLASAIPVRLVLLDPYAGGQGMAAQVRDALSVFDVDRVVVVDVGGDVVARGDEPGLKSPLADALVLAACADLPVPADVVVAGVGLDGELTAGEVRERLRAVGGRVETVLGPRDAEGLGAVFGWHPSEATAMLVAAIVGARGVVEVRDGGMQIMLDDSCAEVWQCPARDLARASLLAPRLAGTATLGEVEDVVREVCGFCEIDHERAKAARLAGVPREPVGIEMIEERVAAFGAACARRGADFVTFRRLAEAAGFGGGDYERVRAHLIRRWPDRCGVPLWPVRGNHPTG
jgi:hypothetical protein